MCSKTYVPTQSPDLPSLTDGAADETEGFMTEAETAMDEVEEAVKVATGTTT